MKNKSVTELLEIISDMKDRLETLEGTKKPEFEVGQMVEIVDWEYYTGVYKPFGVITYIGRTLIKVNIYVRSSGKLYSGLNFNPSSLR